LIGPIQISLLSLYYTIPIMIVFTLILAYFVKSKGDIGKLSGIGLLIAYLIFMIFAFVRGWA